MAKKPETKKPAAKKTPVAPVAPAKRTPPPPPADYVDDDDADDEIEDDDPDLAPAPAGAPSDSGDNEDEEYSFDIDEAAGLIPDGTVCVLTVSKFEAVFASTGNRMFNVKALVDESDYEGAIGRSLFRSLVQTEAAKGFTRAFLKAAGQPYKGAFSIKRREIEGAQFGAIVKIKPETDEFDSRNEIGRFLTVDVARARIAAKTGAAA